ncbi:MAG: acyl-CoA dehydrogenase [Spongiibacteraceae bacterium]|jgi:alkylation response protein AidB-like acyl-CoA dehydrogenase|nr:acyl-CoA dehydrogenase [Spongiibacteraceae bacterium]
MTLVLNEEQRLLKDTAREFVQASAPVGALRKLRDAKDPLCYDPQLWQQMAELGWAGVVMPESYGGLDFGFMGLGAVLEEMGRTLTASPLLASVVLAGQCIVLGGSDAQKQAVLPGIIEGKRTLALALEEGHHHNPTGVALSATRSAPGYTLNGSKTFVLDGASADQLVVVARSSGEPGDTSGISLFLVDADSAGIERTRTVLIDSRNAANIVFNNVSVPADALLGELDKGWAVLDPVLDRARICLAAEMLGGALEAFERTVEYLKDREQFGVKIGSFQALKHRAAQLFTELELAKSVVLDALSAIDDQRADLPALASLAKARLNDVYQLATSEAVQMHGGIGMTDELDIGFFLKRSRTTIQMLGDSGFHRDRYATLNGY